MRKKRIHRNYQIHTQLDAENSRAEGVWNQILLRFFFVFFCVYFTLCLFHNNEKQSNKPWLFVYSETIQTPERFSKTLSFSPLSPHFSVI